MEGNGLLRSWSRLAGRRWVTGVLAFVPIAALGTAFLLLTKPVYRAEASLRLGQPPPPGGVSPAGGIFSFFQMGGDPFSNDMELLASRSLAEALVERLALTATLDAPSGWYRDSLLVSLSTTREVEKGEWSVTWTDAGAVEVRARAGDSLAASVAPGEAARFGGVSAVFEPWREGMPREVSISTSPFPVAVRRVRSGLVLDRPRREANVLGLSFDHMDPALAVGAVAAAVEEFVRLRTRLHARESGETADSLKGVARRTAEELRRAEEALEALQREARIVAPEAQSAALVERQAELLARLQRGRAELAGVEEMLSRLDRVADEELSWTALLSYPAFLESQTLGELLTGLIELHGARDSLASRRAEGNLELRVLEERIAYLDASLRQVAQEYRAGLVEQIATLEPEIATLDAYLAALPAQAVELGRRQRDVRLLGEVLVLTEQRLRQEELRDALTYSNVQVIDAPALRDRPVWPRKGLGLLVVLLLAGGTAALAMVVRDRSDGRVRTVAGLRRLLDAPLLAVVRREPGGRLALSGAQAEALQRGAGAGLAGHGLLLASPGSRAAADEVAEAIASAHGGLAAPAAAHDGREADAHDATRALAVANGHPRSAGAVADHAGAVQVASRGQPVAVVVELGRTGTRELYRLGRLLSEAEAPVSGVIVVCRTRAEEEAAWE